MTYSSLLIDDRRPLVLDTSVLINLNAYAWGGRVLAALPNQILVPEIVAAELDKDVSRRNGGHNFLHCLVASGKGTLADMSDEEYEIYAGLTSGSCSLHDGEAAAIAVAVRRNLLPVVDERKGRSRATAVMGGQEPVWSLDLLRHPKVIFCLGNEMSSHALYLALRDGRMRVPRSSVEYIIGIIGEERSIECTCLPGYRERFGPGRSSN